MDKSCVARLRHLQGTFLVEAAFLHEDEDKKEIGVDNLAETLSGSAAARAGAGAGAPGGPKAGAGAAVDASAAGATATPTGSAKHSTPAPSEHALLTRLRTLRSQMDLHQNLVLQMVWRELSLRRKAEEQVSQGHFVAR